jgi:putative membrane protein
MVDDHTKMQAEGVAIAQAKDLPVPSDPAPRHQAAARQLEQLSGASFDRAYMEQMVKDHAETLQLLERAYAEMKDPDLRAYAQKGIPHVRQHLDAARRIAGDLMG